MMSKGPRLRAVIGAELKRRRVIARRQSPRSWVTRLRARASGVSHRDYGGALVVPDTLGRAQGRSRRPLRRRLRCGAVLAFARLVDLGGALARPLAAGTGAVPGGAELVGHLRPGEAGAAAYVGGVVAPAPAATDPPALAVACSGAPR